MRRSKVISISVCATFFIVSTLILFVVNYLSKATPNMNDELFVPVSVKEVPEEQDIAVQIHPISVVDQTLREKCAGEFGLSDIQKGWMTNLYDGNCRLIKKKKNSDLKDFVQDIKPEIFSNIFLQQNLEPSNHDHMSLYSVKQYLKSNSKEMIKNNDLSDISNIHKTVINSVLADDLTTASSLRKPCSLDDIRNILIMENYY